MSLLLILDKNQHKISLLFGKKWFFSNFEPRQFFSRQNSNFEKKICCTLWWQMIKKNLFAWGQLRNVPRHQKCYCIFRTIFLTVFDRFKPTLVCDIDIFRITSDLLKTYVKALWMQSGWLEATTASYGNQWQWNVLESHFPFLDFPTFFASSWCVVERMKKPQLHASFSLLVLPNYRFEPILIW